MERYADNDEFFSRQTFYIAMNSHDEDDFRNILSPKFKHGGY